jgi:RNA polymerase sigma-70 factor, ECF subfamily
MGDVGLFILPDQTDDDGPAASVPGTGAGRPPASTGATVVVFPGMPADRAPLDLGRLFDSHGAYLVRVLHRLTGSRETAEDVAQEVFLLAYHRRHELEERTGIRTWLYRAAVNHVRHRRRSFSRYQGLLDRYQVHPGNKDTIERPDEVATRAEQGRLVQECVLTLSPKLREVFVLYELEELEGNEIAEILDLPVNTVWSRLRLARAAFRQEWAARAEAEERR